MLRAVVFHYDKDVREHVVDAFRRAGFMTYDAIDPQHALNAVWTYRPNVVITDFPALLENGGGRRTLTEAIRHEPALHNAPIMNLSKNADQMRQDALAAGVTKSVPASEHVGRIIELAYELSRRSDTAGH
jgi:CheY-like chemotaxis protein